MQEIFNTVEELTGTYPTGENLRSAIHAIITKEISWREDMGYLKNLRVSNPTIMNNVEYLSRTYESARGTVQVLYVNGVATEEEYLRFPNNGGN